MAPERDRLNAAKDAVLRFLENGEPRGFNTVISSTEGVLRMDARNALIDLLASGEVSADRRLQVSLRRDAVRTVRPNHL